MLIILVKLALLSGFFAFVSLLIAEAVSPVFDPRLYKNSKTIFKVSSAIFCFNITAIIISLPMRFPY